MEITFHGAAQTVTGSQHLLTVNGHNLLLECGMYQGRRQETYERNLNFPFEPRKIEAVVLSHAHIDHSGNLPNLVKRGFRGPIFATPATAHLANIMLIDAGHIHEADIQFVNKKRARRGEEPMEPLYTQEDAGLVAQHFKPVVYDEEFEPVSGVKARLVDAGHILGSAAISLDIQEKHNHFRLWFSGDIGRLNLPLLRDPVLPERADYVVMECTYGDKPHRDPEESYDELREVTKRTLERGGKVIVPAFAVGRTQEIVYELHRMVAAGELPSVPVYVDSPLAVNATDIFRQHPECFDEETRQFVQAGRHREALGFSRLTYTRSVEESKALNDRHDPMIIISASGMCESGRILHHLRNNIGNPKNTVLIVSWQAPYTLGRRLAEHEQYVKIFGEVHECRAQVATIGGLSAHAGQNFLVAYTEPVRKQARQIFLVHGEPAAEEALRERLVDVGARGISYPEPHQAFEL